LTRLRAPLPSCDARTLTRSSRDLHICSNSSSSSSSIIEWKRIWM